MSTKNGKDISNPTELIRRRDSIYSLNSTSSNSTICHQYSSKDVRDSMETICANDQNGKILVAVRVRPLSSKELTSGHRSCCQVIGDCTISIRKCGDEFGYLKSQQATINDYAFDIVFDDSATQRDVFERTTQNFLPSIFNGQNVTVFAYGSTGAGKTHTMLGNTRADAASLNADAGIIPNALQDLFSLMNLKRKDANTKLQEKWSVSVSFIEVYNEQVYDLIDGTGKVLSLREDQDRGIVVAAGATEQVVDGYDDVIELLTIGNKNRKTEATQMNTVSSRSHAVLLLTVKHSKKSSAASSAKEVIVESKLSLIDLAGSERASATNNRGARLHEGANINKSLLALANCINSLAANNQTGLSSKRLNVKYRDSKLTHLLKSSLEGNCNLVMIANVNPSDSVFEDTHNTLKYANRAKNLKVSTNTSAKEREGIPRQVDKIEEDRIASEDDETAWLRVRVAELEATVQDLQNFKAFTLSSGTICSVCKAKINLKPTLDLQFEDAIPYEHSSAKIQADSDRNSSASNCSALTAISEITTDLDTISASDHLGQDDSENKENQMSSAEAVVPASHSKKRRGSFLPTAKRKRKSIAMRAISNLAAPLSAKKGTSTATPQKSQSRTPGIPSSAIKSAIKAAAAADGGDIFMDGNGEPGKLFLCGPPSASKRGSELQNSRRSSRCVIKRKRSMAQVSAMLDSLSQQNQDTTVSVSLRSAAGKAPMFQSILTTSKDDNALFSSAASSSRESISAPLASVSEEGAGRTLRSTGIKTRSMLVGGDAAAVEANSKLRRLA